MLDSKFKICIHKGEYLKKMLGLIKISNNMTNAISRLRIQTQTSRNFKNPSQIQLNKIETRSNTYQNHKDQLK